MNHDYFMYLLYFLVLWLFFFEVELHNLFLINNLIMQEKNGSIETKLPIYFHSDFLKNFSELFLCRQNNKSTLYRLLAHLEYTCMHAFTVHIALTFYACNFMLYSSTRLYIFVIILVYFCYNFIFALFFIEM